MPRYQSQNEGNSFLLNLFTNLFLLCQKNEMFSFPVFQKIGNFSKNVLRLVSTILGGTPHVIRHNEAAPHFVDFGDQKYQK